MDNRYGLSKRESELILRLWECRVTTIRNYAQYAGLRYPAAYAHFRNLFQNGFLDREPLPKLRQGEREFLYFLSKKGQVAAVSTGIPASRKKRVVNVAAQKDSWIHENACQLVEVQLARILLCHVGRPERMGELRNSQFRLRPDLVIETAVRSYVEVETGKTDVHAFARKLGGYMQFMFAAPDPFGHNLLIIATDQACFRSRRSVLYRIAGAATVRTREGEHRFFRRVIAVLTLASLQEYFRGSKPRKWQAGLPGAGVIVVLQADEPLEITRFERDVEPLFWYFQGGLEPDDSSQYKPAMDKRLL